MKPKQISHTTYNLLLQLCRDIEAVNLNHTDNQGYVLIGPGNMSTMQFRAKKILEHLNETTEQS